MSSLGRVRLVTAAVPLVFSLIACEAFGIVSEPRSGFYPEACARWNYPARMCDAIVDDALDSAGLAKDQVEAVEFLPFERVQTLGGGQVALVRFHLVDGTTVDQDVRCVGVNPTRLACNGNAHILTNSGVDSDVPCAGEAPNGCATLPPEPDAATVAAATPFAADSIDVQLDHEGSYEVRLGTATLADGYLFERSFTLGNATPDTFWIDEPVRIDVRPDVAGRPPVGSRYREPFDGPEPVTIYLVFDVSRLDSPSVLQVRDVVVR
jgi:hypothetical protein